MRLQLIIWLLLFGWMTNSIHAQEVDTTEVQDVEIDFLGSYYEQDGNHSAVMGGYGTQELTDAVGVVQVKIPFQKNILNLMLGIDTYTSASTDMIDMQESGASYNDERAYGHLDYTRLTDKAGDYSIGFGYSKEWDVKSLTFNGGWQKESFSKNYSYGVNLLGIFDAWELIYPTELRSDLSDPESGNGLKDDQRKTFGVSLFYSQVLSKKFQLAINYDLVMQQGLLSTPFHRVYFDTTGVSRISDKTIEEIQALPTFFIKRDIERLPNQRIKHALALRTSWYATDFLLLRTFTRAYTDDFGIQALTMSVEMPIKFTRFSSISPFYRYHAQNGSKYFQPIFVHSSDQNYYSSDWDLADLQSHKYGAQLRISPAFGILQGPQLTQNRNHILFKYFELRYAHYTRNDGLNANIVSAGFGFTL